MKSNNKLNCELVQQTISGGHLRQEIRLTTKSGEHEMTFGDLQDIFTELNKKDVLFSMIVYNRKQPWTIKSFDNDYLDYETFEDYYKGSVKEIKKFENFNRIDIIVRKDIKDVKGPIKVIEKK